MTLPDIAWTIIVLCICIYALVLGWWDDGK